MSEQDSMSERELAEFFHTTGALTDEPRSVGEALAATDEQEQPTTPDEEQEVVVEPPIVVQDEPGMDTGEDAIAPELPAEPAVEPEAEDIGEDIEDENVAWATKKYGDDPAKWAQAARHQEQHISRLAAEKKEAEGLAVEWAQYAETIQAQATQQQQMAMPLSASEEEWIERAVMNPYQAAQQAAYQGNVNLYNGVLARVAEENPAMAAQIGAQVQMEIQQLAAQQNGAFQQQQPQPSLADEMAGSIQRLGIDLDTYGEPMSQKIAELGEFDPYVQTILEGEPQARDMALRAVYDLVRTGAMSTRKVRTDERDAQIRHEAELRRQAAGVVTGGPHQEPPPTQPRIISAMEEEWRARGQWSDD
jgi:hypothetical protein